MKAIPLANDPYRVALVDDADYAAVSRFSWALHSTGYAYRYLPREGRKQQHQFLHQFLLGEKPGVQIDHWDTDKLNNQRENLRWATQSQNNTNCKKRVGTSSRYKGVSWFRATGKWRARIKVGKLHISLGLFIFEDDAARVYDSNAVKFFGEFARLNFPK